MRKGSRALRCCKCGRIVGWMIPTGKVHHGIPEVAERLNDSCTVENKYFSRFYYCETCTPTQNQTSRYDGSNESHE